jgi:YVTN family beta-propeller protein
LIFLSTTFHEQNDFIKISDDSFNSSLENQNRLFTLNKETSNIIKLKIAPSSFRLYIDGKYAPIYRENRYIKEFQLPEGSNELLVVCQGYISKKFYKSEIKQNFIEDKLEKRDSLLKKISEINVGNQPKSVLFSKDGKFIFSALLDGEGVDVISVEQMNKIATLTPPEKFSKKKGFVELLIIESLNELWVSQMTTGYLHIFNLPDLTYKSSISTKGIYPKVLIKSSDEGKVYVSNWLSKDISIIDTKSRKLIEKFSVADVPRGMAISPDEKYLYICLFEGKGVIQKIDLKTKDVQTLNNIPKGAKRHIIFDSEKNLFYISDMYRASIFVLKYPEDKIIKEIKVAPNLNTIALSYDKKYLYISSRGPNNPETYLLKGPEYGRIFIFDTESLKLVDYIWGRNQPTGLDVSADGKIVAFSDFLDNKIEIYENIKYE